MSSPAPNLQNEPEVIQCLPQHVRRGRNIQRFTFQPTLEHLTEAELRERNEMAEILAHRPTKKRKRKADEATPLYVAPQGKARDTRLQGTTTGPGQHGIIWRQVPIPPTPQKLLETRRANLPKIMAGAHSKSSQPTAHPPGPVHTTVPDIDPGGSFDIGAPNEQPEVQPTRLPTRHQLVSDENIPPNFY